MNDLRQRLLTAPRWVVGLVSAVPFGIVMGLGTGLRHGSWRDGLIEGVIAGAVYGVFMGLVMHRQFARYREAMGSVPPSAVRKVAREARRGRVPEDADARRAAYRVLGVQLEQLRSQRRWVVPFLARRRLELLRD